VICLDGLLYAKYKKNNNSNRVYGEKIIDELMMAYYVVLQR